MAQTIGEQLKQARQKRGLSLLQVSQATHIRTHYLEALENDRREDLPSPVQGRGFLRLVAGCLDIPAEPLLTAWDGKETVAEPEVENPLPPVEQPESTAEVIAASPVASEISPVQPGQSPSEQAPAIHEEGQPASSQIIFSEIGQKLRNQREALGLTQVEVERYTRLRTHYIQAMEEGRIDKLPSPVQGRGMISNYAAFLNLDEEAVLLRFAEGLQARRIERLPKPGSQPLFNGRRQPARRAPAWRRFLTPDLIFGVGVAAIILSFALWSSARISAQRSAQTQPTPPGISEMLLTPNLRGQSTALALTPQGTALAVGSANSVQTPPPSSGVNATVDPASNQNQGAQASARTGTPVGTATLPPINKDPLQVYIVARQRAYLKVVADDKVKFLGRTVPGNAYAFSGSKRLELSTGNAAALQVFYNQMDLGILGIEGEVVNLIFSAEGITTPTPAFTPTSLPTKQPTITPLPSATPQATPTITPLIP